MKRKDKQIDKIPVPVEGKSYPHPFKFKLSHKPTAVKKRVLSFKRVSFKNRKMRDLFKRYRFGDLCGMLYSMDDVDKLKRLYFKGWLMSR